MKQNRLISHNLKPETLERTLETVGERIQREGDKPYASINMQLELLTQLSQFDFGRYLLQNQGINGYWTDYMLTHPWFGRETGKNNRGEPISALESFILNRSPLMLATQERFSIFLRENQKQVRNGAHLASIPCGLMGELLYLNYNNISNIILQGFDYDPESLNEASQLAQQKGLTHFTKLVEQDVWDLSLKHELDLISSNGLTIYEADDEKVTELYRLFYKALKSGGKLVTSFLTPPPQLTDSCEWDFALLDQADLLLQKIIFVDIINAKFQCYRSSEQAHQQLREAGFTDIKFIYDRAKLFPTVVAQK